MHAASPCNPCTLFLRPYGQQTLPGDYVPLARHPGTMQEVPTIGSDKQRPDTVSRSIVYLSVIAY
jgi:hypothetical protein